MRSNRLTRVLLLLLVMGIRNGWGGFAWANEDDPNIALLTMLADVQDANRNEIGSYELTMREWSNVYTVHAGEIQQHTMNTIHWEIRKGKLSRISRKRGTEVRSMPNVASGNDELRMVICETYLAQWFVSNPIIYVYEFESQDNWSEEVRRFAKALNPRTPERYGFGNGSMTARELVEFLMANSDWVSVSVKNENTEPGVFQVILTDNNQVSVLTEIRINSEKGGIISRCKEYSDGDLISDIEVEAKFIDGVWFPHRWTVRHYARLAEREPTLVRESINEILSLKINPLLEDSEFTWQALDAPEDLVVLRKDSKGKERLMTVDEGELIPGELAP